MESSNLPNPTKPTSSSKDNSGTRFSVSTPTGASSSTPSTTASPIVILRKNAPKCPHIGPNTENSPLDTENAQKTQNVHANDQHGSPKVSNPSPLSSTSSPARASNNIQSFVLQDMDFHELIVIARGTTFNNTQKEDLASELGFRIWNKGLYEKFVDFMLEEDQRKFFMVPEHINVVKWSSRIPIQYSLEIKEQSQEHIIKFLKAYGTYSENIFNAYAAVLWPNYFSSILIHCGDPLRDWVIRDVIRAYQRAVYSNVRECIDYVKKVVIEEPGRCVFNFERDSDRIDYCNCIFYCERITQIKELQTPSTINTLAGILYRLALRRRKSTLEAIFYIFENAHSKGVIANNIIHHIFAKHKTGRDLVLTLVKRQYWGIFLFLVYNIDTSIIFPLSAKGYKQEYEEIWHRLNRKYIAKSDMIIYDQAVSHISKTIPEVYDYIKACGVISSRGKGTSGEINGSYGEKGKSGVQEGSKVGKSIKEGKQGKEKKETKGHEGISREELSERTSWADENSD